MNGFLKVTLIKVFGFALSLLIGIAAINWYVREASKVATQSMSNIAANSQKQLQAIKDRQIAEQQEKELKAVQVQLAQQAADKAAAEKERGWNSYYKEPKHCLNWQTDKQMVECINFKMAEKQKFDQLWAVQH